VLDTLNLPRKGGGVHADLGGEEGSRAVREKKLGGHWIGGEGWLKKWGNEQKALMGKNHLEKGAIALDQHKKTGIPERRDA